MKALVFDTETTGLLAGSDPTHPDQPRLVQFAALLLDEDLRQVSSVSLVVQPDIKIPPGATAIHGIGDWFASEHGVPEKAVVGIFLRLCSVATVLVAHNADFDLQVMRAATLRAKAPWRVPPARCTMVASTEIVQCPPTQRMIDSGRTGFKPPNLAQALRSLTGREMEGAHNAMVDAMACADVYRALVGRGVKWEELRRAS